MNEIKNSCAETSNRDDPLGLLEPKKTQELIAESLSIVSPEIEALKEKLATLERKMKKRAKKVCRKRPQPSASCCGHFCQANCCPTSNRGPVMPPMYPDAQSDLFAEFWNRVMASANEKTPATNNARSSRRVGKNKLLVLNKRKMKVSVKRKAKKCVGSSNWEVESDDNENQIGHLLRLKKRGDFIEESSITETEETSKSHSDGVDESLETIDKEPIISETSPRRSSLRIRERGLRRTPEIKRKTVNTSFIETSSVSVDQSLAADAPAESDLVSARDRSISCSPSPAPSINNCEIAKNPNLAEIDVNVDLHDTDTDLNVSMNSTEETIRESRSELFHDDTSQEATCFSQTLHEKTRKRKRSNSLTRSKRSVKSKLLCKLRALKKNTTPVTIPLVNIHHCSIANSSSPIEKNHDDSKKNDCSQDSSTTEPLIEIASKKNRIAHVPKTWMSKERDKAAKENEILEKKFATNVPHAETRGVHFHLNRLQDISQTMKKPKIRVTKIKSPTTRSVSNDKMSFETINNSCLISPETDKTNATDNILESSVSCENEENDESCKKAVMKIEGPTKLADRPEPSLDEKKDFAAWECIDESPASPSDTQKSNSPNACLDSTGSPKNFYPASIYETAVLPDESPTTDKKSDTILLQDFRVNVGKVGVTDEKEKPLANNVEEKSQAIVKDLRTRSILCSYVRQSLGDVDQQNLPKSTNPTIRDNSLDKIGANHRGIRTLETLLTRHLGSQKKKCRTKPRMLRKSAAIKLQTDAGKFTVEIYCRNGAIIDA